MKFKRLVVHNFMSVGDEGLELFFTDLSGIVLISGRNLDISKSSGNGAGKSLIIEAILWALYGKTLRGLTKNEVINNINGKRCQVILDVDDLRIVRSRKPNKLKLFQDPTGAFSDEAEISQSTMPRTENVIQEKIGIDFTTFCNIFCFGQHNVFSFISADEKTRRKIVEDLLSLSDYNICLENTRSSLRAMKSEIKELVGKFELLQKELDDHKTTRESYLRSKKKQDEKLKSEIAAAVVELKKLEILDIEIHLEKWKGYDRAQSEIPKVQEEASKVSIEVRERKGRVSRNTSEINAIDKELDKIKNLEAGVKCSNCFGTVDPKNAQSIADGNRERRGELLSEAEVIMERVVSLEKVTTKLRGRLTELKSVPVPSITREFLRRVQGEVQKWKGILEEKRKHSLEDPYTPLIKQEDEKISDLTKRTDEFRNSMRRKDKIVPYLSFWIDGFGPEGIRSFIVENVVGFLNNQVNYWLQFLIDNKIVVSFDKFLDVDIKRQSDENFTYKQGSGGEKKRIDLAISLAFADLMRISNDTHNSIMFLDEVVDSLDFSGVNGIYHLMTELSKDKTVFVITHNPTLLGLLQESTNLKILKHGGFSSIEELSKAC